MWTRKQVAETIDHAALKPFIADDDIREACRIGRKYGVASVCVRPSGGIRTYETACQYLDMGAKRLGVASTEAVLEAAPEG